MTAVETNPNAFKNWFDRALVENLAKAVKSAESGFDDEAFVDDASNGLDRLELKERVRAISGALWARLGPDFPHAAATLIRALPAPLDNEAVTDAMIWWPFCDVVERFGHRHPEVALDAMYELTQRFSAEFAVRPYLRAHPDLVLSRFHAWASDPSVHVRRWVSEGTRPRLPWGGQLRSFIAEPAPVLRLLELLRHDPSEYVRRSVANNLNDIAKDHPDLVVATAARWWGDSTADERRMIRHALRTLVKQGHAPALDVLGFGRPSLERCELRVEQERVRFPGELVFTVQVASSSLDQQRLLIDYAVHHVRANGARTRKVFKWSTRTISAGAELSLTKRHWFKPISTRAYYPGTHLLEVQINGVVVAKATFDLEIP